MTLNGDTHTVAEKMPLSEPSTKSWMKIDQHYRWQKCRPMTVVSGGIRFMRIFAEVPRGGVSNDSGVVENGNFQRFCCLFFGYFRDETSVIIWRYAVRRRLFTDPKMHDLVKMYNAQLYSTLYLWYRWLAR